MLVLLQIWGGVFFLLNKVFLSFDERAKKSNSQKYNWRLFSWIVFLIGVPAWIIIFVIDHNWIAAALEAGGIPSMLIGLLASYSKNKNKEPLWLRYCALMAIVLGLGYSLYDFNGLKTLTQFSELVMTAGFLVGTYQVAKERPSGYLWYIVMHLACIMLMYLQKHPWLLAQQILSIFFVVDAYYCSKKAS